VPPKIFSPWACARAMIRRYPLMICLAHIRVRREAPGRRRLLTEADVVNALKENHVADIGHGEDVAAEPGERRLAKARRVVQHFVAADPFIYGLRRPITERSNQPLREEAGPPVVGVDLVLVTIRDRVTECHYRPFGTPGPTTYHFSSQQTNYVASGDQAAAEGRGFVCGAGVDPPAGSSWFLRQ
jgi:hypothetical protein